MECPVCHIDKPNNGIWYNGICKDCYLEQRRLRERRTQIRYYETHKQHLLECQRKYNQEHKEARNKYQKNYMYDYYRKHKTEQKVRLEAWLHAPIGSKCVICGSTEKLHRHHPNYEKPLEIVTLCNSCHMKVHSGRLKL